MKVDALIEKGLDGTFDVHFGEDTKGLTFGLLGQGNTVTEAIADFYHSRDEMKELYIKTGQSFPDNLEFNFKYDTASFLAYYSKVLSLAGLQRITGVNQGQLSHYVTGHRRPSPKTVEKIEKSLHAFAEEISQVHFV
ncbi:MAG TPA: DNA-binding protein [Prolixibacteraceae bacterium]|jgi:predicted RNase H-like HicB family nuclease|nr:DNA-binding protein [Prolixibacteraceae bacterium]